MDLSAMYAVAGPLTLGLLIGGMSFFSFLVAPLSFRILGEAQAGKFVRGLFPYYYLFVIVAAALAIVGTVARNPTVSIMMVGVLVLGVIARQVLMPMINRARDRQMAGDAGAKRRFGLLHGLSVVINFVQLGAAVVGVGLYAIGLSNA
jgi:hypothetical protein